MGSKGQATQEKILNIAQNLVLQKGFSATSLDEIIELAGLTKGGFFYHFKGKSELATRLIDRYLRQDEAFFHTLLGRADALSEDPLQQMLIFLNLFAEAMADLEGTHPGCLVASYTYESQQFEKDLQEMMALGVLSWRRLFSERIERITQKYSARLTVSPESLADNLSAMLEGGIVLSRVLQDKRVLVEQILQFRNYLRLLYDSSC